MRFRARELAVDVRGCDETQYGVGLGVEGQVNGDHMYVGNECFMRQSEIKVDAAAFDPMMSMKRRLLASTPRWTASSAGLVPFSDEIRAGKPPVIQQLHAMGIRNMVMLTGDNGVVARAVLQRSD